METTPFTEMRENLTDEDYIMLYEVLHRPVEKETISQRAFTGNPTVDILILEELSDKDLISTCGVNRYVASLCQNEYFWMRRTVDRYGKFLGDAQKIRQKYIPEDISWKDYYIWLTDSLSTASTNYADVLRSGREDLLILSRKLYVPPEEYTPLERQNSWTPKVLRLEVRRFLNKISTRLKKFGTPLNQILSFKYNGTISSRLLDKVLEDFGMSGELNLPPKVAQILFGDSNRTRVKAVDFRGAIFREGFKSEEELTDYNKRLINDPEIKRRLDIESSTVYGDEIERERALANARIEAMNRIAQGDRLTLEEIRNLVGDDRFLI